MQQQQVLLTERLLLRPFTIEDAERVNELAGDYDVAKSTLSIPHPYSLEIARTWIESQRGSWENCSGVIYAVTLIKENELIGVVSLMEIKDLKANLGYWIGKDYWGHGYCSEAVRALLKYSRDNLKLSRISAAHLTSNPASGRVMKKNDMRHVRTEEIIDRSQNKTTVEIYEIFNT